MQEKPTNNLNFFRVVDVQNIDTMLKFWPFLCEGLGKLNSTAFRAVDKDTLFKVVVDVVSSVSLGKLVIVMENGQPMSFCVAFENTSRYSKDRTMLVYAIYSNGLRKGATGHALSYVEKWSKEEGFLEMHGNSQRITGGAARLWGRSFGYQKRSMLLVKPL